MGTLAIEARHLSKQYEIGSREQYRALRDVISDTVRLPLRWLSPGGRANAASEGKTRIWALDDVSFDIRHGDVLGIIGSNGAGKSTLLKILSRITKPTSGSATVHGRVGSLLEVGTGFHPELTGRENVFLSGSVLGMRRAEIARKFDEIVEFAETSQFIDTAVKHYSIGMYMRLAFAVAANLEPDILIIDEVLAVGDVAFQKKCLGKMSDVANDGRTVLFVSHNLDAMQRLCNRAILFEHGKLTAEGETTSVVNRYLTERAHVSRPDELIDLTAHGRVGTGEARCVAASYSSGNEALGMQPYSGGPLTFTLHVDAQKRRDIRSVAVHIFDQAGMKLLNADTMTMDQAVHVEQGHNVLTIAIQALHLNPGRYRIGFRLANPLTNRERSGVFDAVSSAFEIDVVSSHQTTMQHPPDAYVTCDFSVEGRSA